MVTDISDNAAVNSFVPKAKRAVPFESIVFIGDGAIDIPCFRLVKEQGGLPVVVYMSDKHGGRTKAAHYFDDGRVDTVVSAICIDGSVLDKIIKARIDGIEARNALESLMKA